MDKLDIILSIIAHFSLICTGITSFNILSHKLENQYAESPILQLFLIFGIYGGLTLFSLHILTWTWSGMASVGAATLIFIAPLIGLWVTNSLRKTKTLSRWHKTLFTLGLLYIPIAIVILGSFYLITVSMKEGY
jgi:hypothetical protein